MEVHTKQLCASIASVTLLSTSVFQQTNRLDFSLDAKDAETVKIRVVKHTASHNKFRTASDLHLST